MSTRPASSDGDYRTFYRDRRVMITGGLGFIGSTLAHQLVELGARVLIVDSLIPDYGGNLFNIAGIEDRVRVNIADVRQSSTMNHLVRDQDVAGDPRLHGVLDFGGACRDRRVDLESDHRVGGDLELHELGQRLRCGTVERPDV